MLHPIDIKTALDSMVVICDTREQPTLRAQMRLRAIGVPVERKALPFGDYSAYCILPDGARYSLEEQVSIERKMGLGELCACYCHGRERFEREFERAKAAGAKLYLLVENASFEAAYFGRYNSKMRPAALIGSILAWLARYDCQLIFCKQQTSGRLIHDILYRELKERLETI